MSPSEFDNDWKLKLRYGKIKTAYEHFSVIADGVAKDVADGFDCQNGNAFMGMKVWASDTEEAADMAQVIGDQIGFSVTGRIQIYKSEPEEPPRENPYGYSIKFTPYDNKSDGTNNLGGKD